LIKLTRSKLEALVEPLVARSLKPVEIALKDAKLKTSDINDVILVGGQTRMPMVQEKVKEFFGNEPRKDINPDEAVAVGAAVQGAVLSGDVTDILLLDVTPLTLGIETMGGVMTPVIEKNTTIPTNKSQIFSTAEDNQTAVTVNVVQGERKQAKENKQLGLFNLDGIPAAPRGMPQIEVSFDIDANGILNVSAKDKATDKEQSITIQASGGLSEEEIEKMVTEAEANAEEDKIFEEMVQARNSADTLIHSCKKTLEESADKVEENEKTQIEEAITVLEEAMKGEDKQEIEDKTKALAEASSSLAQRLYAEQQENASTDQDSQESQASDDTAVDADFEEVKEEAKEQEK
jgi:molecular chaperone DnaK